VTLSGRLSAGNNKFGIDLVRLLSVKGDKNLLVSPISLTTNLQLLLAGTQGVARVELERALHVGEIKNPVLVKGVKALTSSFDTSEGSKVEIANSIWLSPKLTIKPAFATLAKDGFGARATQLKALGAPGAAEINSWVNEKTKGRIPTLVSSLDALTRVVLVNAVTFDGKWKSPFIKDHTSPRPFHGTKGTKNTDTMSQSGQFAVGKSGNVRLIQIPYQGHTSMLIALPDMGGDPAKAAQSFQRLPKLDPSRVELQLPKFTFRDEHQLNSSLQDLGISQVFQEADFSTISSNPQLNHVSEVIQKTFVKVDEEGTEAAAATGVIISAKAIIVQPQAVQFHVDHPFAFAIRDDQTGTLLFIGVVKNL
jgi:serpin B